MGKRELSIGRSKSCDICLSQSCDYASNYHSTIYCEGNRLLYKDTSTNGTFINNKFVHKMTVQIERGDYILIAGKYHVSWSQIDSCLNQSEAMPLFRRFVGSMIDKMFILVAFVLIFIAIDPYGSAGKLGTYRGMMNASPVNYEYIDRAAMNRYDTYKNSIRQYHQDEVPIDRPHIGSMLELDLSITFSFIFLNLLYYILFEAIISASLGKRMLGGLLLDSSNAQIGLGKVLLRALCGGALMSIIVFLFRFVMLLNCYIVIVVFFLILDIPVLFLNRSLIDIVTGTNYAKR